MTEATGEDHKTRVESGKKAELETYGPVHEEKNRTESANYRDVSYMVLFIAAVFVINAMETGSYRTPWPVAVSFCILGFGLLCYSFYLQSRDRS
jgi:hypothetical protein